MPRQHFRCPNCGTLDLITYRVADVGDPEVWPPICGTPECFDVRMINEPQPGDFAMDLKTDGDGGKGFQKFTVTRQQPARDGQLVQQTETIDSLHALRKIEKDSEQRYINGEGEPLRFRGYAMNQSNIDVGAFGREGTIGGRAYDSGHALPKKPEKVDIRRHGEKKPKVKVARGAGASPLKDL